MRILLVVALLVSAASCAPSARADSDHAPGELIVKFRSGVTGEQRADTARSRGARVERQLPIPGAAIVEIAPDADVESAAAALERDPHVEFAEPNVLRKAGAAPNDPMRGEEWWLDTIQAPRAWDRTTGSADVRVAVLDSGVNLDQPDLAANVATNPGESGGGRESNGADDDGNGFVDDWRGWDFVQRDNEPADNYGHGSMVAGILAARGNEGFGMTGVAWRAGIVPVRVLGNLKSGTCAEIASGMAYAVRVGARVVNVSLGADSPCELERQVMAAAPNTLFVAASMNDGRDVDAQPVYPCAYPDENLVCVAGTTRADELASWSDYGAHSVDLAAPGEGIVGPGVKVGERETIVTDGFESPIWGRWYTGGYPDTWNRSFAPRTGGFALSDSPFTAYADGTDSYAGIAGGLDLAGKRDCVGRVYARWQLGPVGLSDPDIFIVEISRDGVTWEPMEGRAGASLYDLVVFDLARIEGGPGYAGLRFRLKTNGSGSFDGVHLDDFAVFCFPHETHLTGAPDEYVEDYGTSYSAPQVSGAAALLLSADPSLSARALKRAILQSADPLPSLAGTTVTGARLNVARALDTVAPAAPAARAVSSAPPAARAPAGAAPAVVKPAADARATTRRGLTCPKGGEGRAVCRKLVRRIKACDRTKRARRPACIRRALKRARAGCLARRTPRRRLACAKTLAGLAARVETGNTAPRSQRRAVVSPPA